MNFEERHNRIPIITGNKYCMRCRTSKPQAGGTDVLSADKLRRKWHCADCRKGKE